MAEPLEFKTEPRQQPADGETPEQAGLVPVTIDGVLYHARRPKDAIAAQLGPVLSRRTPPLVKMQLVLDFLEDCLLEPGRTVLRNRLLDPADDFDVSDAVTVLSGIANFWKAHPPVEAPAPR
jgi:hypothetical protein